MLPLLSYPLENWVTPFSYREEATPAFASFPDLPGRKAARRGESLFFRDKKKHMKPLLPNPMVAMQKAKVGCVRLSPAILS